MSVKPLLTWSSQPVAIKPQKQIFFEYWLSVIGLLAYLFRFFVVGMTSLKQLSVRIFK